MTEERRRSPRFLVEIPVRVTVGGAAYPASLRDICRDAALVEAERAWPLDTEVALAMELPGTGGPLKVVGRIVRLADGDAGGLGLAILFTEVSAAAGNRIDFFVALHG